MLSRAFVAFALGGLLLGTVGCQESGGGGGTAAPTSSVPDTTTPLTTSAPAEATTTTVESPSSSTPGTVPAPKAGASSTAPGSSAFSFEATALDAERRRRMTGVSWRAGCPVGLDDLRLVVVSHWGFDGQIHRGHLIVHADAAETMRTAFKRLFEAGFRIRQVRPIDDFGGDDFTSIEADNTSAFNCRPTTGSTTVWSQHAYGRAIDVNPLENPYVTRGTTSHERSKPYLDRSNVRPGMILPSSPATAAFAAGGWKWGGEWTQPVDLQHFSANGR
jgi:hypothetical protein